MLTKNWFNFTLLILVALISTFSILNSSQNLQQTCAEIIQTNSLAPAAKPACQPQGFTEALLPLQGLKIPLYPQSQRLTFDSLIYVRYRANTLAPVISNFYSQILSKNCWQQIGQEDTINVYQKKNDFLAINLITEALSQKTYINYTVASANARKTAVLGITTAQADAGTLSPIESAPVSEPAPFPSNTSPMSSPENPASSQESLPPATNQPTGSQPLTQPEPAKPAPADQNLPAPQSFSNPAQQTCRVNGVDMPGSCELYNKSTQTGPSEEEVQKMNERRFQDMKRGLKNFTQNIKMVKKGVTQLKKRTAKCGVGLPEELENALTSSDELIAKIQSAKNADELEDIVTTIEDTTSVINDWSPRLGELNRLCDMLKRADKDLKQIERSFKKTQSQSKTNKKIDLSSIIAEYQNEVTALREALNQSKTLAKTDPESALAMLEDDFYGQMDNVHNKEAAINTALNVSRGLRDADREIKSFKQQIAALKRQKIDTSQAESTLSDLQTRINELKQLIKGSFDADDLIDSVDATYEARGELQDLLQDLRGEPESMSSIKIDKRLNVNIEMPDAYIKQPLNNSSGNNNFIQKNP